MKPAMNKVLGLIPSRKETNKRMQLNQQGRHSTSSHITRPHIRCFLCLSCSIPVIKCKADVVILIFKESEVRTA